MLNHGKNVVGEDSSLHLTIQSSEIIKLGKSVSSILSISCDISEVPAVNCNLLIYPKHQDIGSIGSIKFEKNRPVASATLNLSDTCFIELKDLLRFSPPRPASIYLNTSRYQENSNDYNTMKNSGISLDVYDLSWRYPIL